jgi:hypothetical protein
MADRLDQRQHLAGAVGSDRAVGVQLLPPRLFAAEHARRAGGLVAPEFQIVDEVSVAGYLNTLQTTIDVGAGATVNGARDVRSTYAAEVALASDPGALVDRVNLLLMNGRMSGGLRTRILEALGSINVPTTGAQTTITTALTNRAKLAIYMTMASSEYLVQR